MKYVEIIKCDLCNKLHLRDSETFALVSGNITIGMGGGVVGNNIENDKVINTSCFCYPDCLVKALGLQEVVPPDDSSKFDFVICDSKDDRPWE
jgi:hypothetical protein